jgi:regulator of sigma E protease
VVSAGPIANFLLAIVLFTVIFRVQGLSTVLPIVDEVKQDGAAYAAGIKTGDVILKIDNEEIKDFEKIRQIVTLSADKTLLFLIEREGKKIEVELSPKISATKDIFGDEVKVGLVGITASKVEYTKLGLVDSFVQANVETYRSSVAILKAIGELVIGKRSIKELGGPVKIAEYSGKSMSMGLMVVLWFMGMISINLGVANLLPIPVLDGGHLFFYIIEAIIGRPLPEKVQEYGFRAGFAILLTLMLFTTYNDILKLFVK